MADPLDDIDSGEYTGHTKKPQLFSLEYVSLL